MLIDKLVFKELVQVVTFSYLKPPSVNTTWMGQIQFKNHNPHNKQPTTEPWDKWVCGPTDLEIRGLGQASWLRPRQQTAWSWLPPAAPVCNVPESAGLAQDLHPAQLPLLWSPRQDRGRSSSEQCPPLPASDPHPGLSSGPRQRETRPAVSRTAPVTAQAAGHLAAWQKATLLSTSKIPQPLHSQSMKGKRDHSRKQHTLEISVTITQRKAKTRNFQTVFKNPLKMLYQ